MEGTVPEKEKCSKCGVDIRENTMFCYNCGTSIEKAEAEVAAPAPAEGDTSAPPEETESPKAPVSEKKRTRAGRRMPTKVVWDVPGRNADRLYLLICFVIFLIAALVVIVMTIMK
ncbi:MAG: zinc ribbon domain-containing protein [Chloracidobacterium sp.]|nr:zinc ribbon domain-containing protein [Chloracidobacterium sp.]